MAEVATSHSMSSKSITESNRVVSDASNDLLFPQSVKDAIDRILPSSATQLLHPPEKTTNKFSQKHPDWSLNGHSVSDLSNSSHDQLDPATGEISNSNNLLQESRDDSSCRTKSRSNSGLNKKGGATKRISKADLEIMTAIAAPLNDVPERSGKRRSEPSSSDTCLKNGSDSDDVSRPFVPLKERKKKKKLLKKYRSAAAVYAEGQMNKSGQLNSNSVSGDDLNVDKSLSADCIEDQLPGSGTLNISASINNNSQDSRNNSRCSSPDHISSKACLSSDDISNNSFSSSKENVDCILQKKSLEHQKLPKVKYSHYHLEKHKNRVRKTFPPCCIVIEQIHGLLSSSGVKTINLSGINNVDKVCKVLPLSVRLKMLFDHCEKGLIPCRKNKSDTFEYKYKNIFEECLLPDSEDDFQVPRSGRSLRKRKTISYVEPTEADIFPQFSRKRSRNNSKEADDVDSRDSKRKKTGTSEDTPAALGINPVYSSLTATNSTRNVTIYPESQTNSASASKNAQSKSQTDTRYSVSNPVSWLSSTNSNHFMAAAHPALNSMLAAGNTASSLSSSSADRPQFCMVKMDGKDVLLQVLPASAPGAAPHGATLLLPGGRRLVVPPSHALSQQINKAPRILNPLSVPMSNPMFSAFPHPMHSFLSSPTTCVVSTTASNSNVMSLFTGQGISSRTMTPVSLSTIPRLSNTSVAMSNRGAPRLLPPALSLSYPYSTSAQPITYTPVTVYPRTIVSTTKRPSISTLAPAMAAPNSTTVVRNTRAPTPLTNARPIAPNQANIRAVRIFVPGCQSTGIPGRFTTLGSVGANSSALTRLTASSELLPQRKMISDSLTEEQRAEKRRRLEKKYPLPPGVVIKTESLDPSPSVQTSSSTSRSLINLNNIQLVQARGSGVQNIRIVNPSSSAAGTLPPVIVQASSSSGRQTLLIPSSLGMLTTNARGSLVPHRRGTLATTAVTCLSSSNNVSVLSALNSATVTTSTSTTTTSTSSYSSLVRNKSTTACVSSTQTSLEKEVANLDRILKAQQAAGLRGERLEKLLALFDQKKKMLKEEIDKSSQQHIASTQASTLTTCSTDPPDVIEID